MKITLVLFAFILFVYGSVANVPEDPKVENLSWMAGCWVQKGRGPGSFTAENWTKPMGLMLGTNRSVKDSKVRSYEYLRIESRADGVYYVAKPSSAASEISFKLKSLRDKKVVFENLEHDFPKRIIYSLASEKNLQARAEDDSKGFNLSFFRVDCDD